jgi:hypothetical protein
METTLGICLYSYLYLKLAKPLCLSYYLLRFLFNKIGEGDGTGSARGRGGGGEVDQTMHTHVSKCRNDKIKDREKKSTIVFKLKRTRNMSI